MVLLDHLHLFQVQLLSKHCDHGDFDAVSALNTLTSCLVMAFFEHPGVEGSQVWAPIRGMCDLTDQATLKLIRREVLRLLGGTHVRLALIALQEPRAFWRDVKAATMADNDDLILQAIDALTFQTPCCCPSSVKQILGMLGREVGSVIPPPVADIGDFKELAKAVDAVQKPSIKATERNHAGNRHRAKISGRVRTWRRQVAQFIVTRSRERFVKIPQGKKRLRYVTSDSWRRFRSRATMTTRRGVGGNGLREFINRKSKQARGMYNREQFKIARQRWVTEYRAMSRDQRRQVSEEFHQTQRMTKARLASDLGLHANVVQEREDNAFVSRTHWRCGSIHLPLSEDKFKEFIATQQPVSEHNRNGLRKIARTILPEASLVVPPTGKKLVAPRSRECFTKHPGFCRMRHAYLEAADFYSTVFELLKAQEKETRAGMVLLRFVITDEREDPGATPPASLASDCEDECENIEFRPVLLHFLFASFRNRPRYTASYVACKFESEGDKERAAEGNFPYTVVAVEFDRPAVPMPTSNEPGFDVDTMTSWKVARVIADRLSWVLLRWGGGGSFASRRRRFCFLEGRVRYPIGDFSNPFPRPALRHCQCEKIIAFRSVFLRVQNVFVHGALCVLVVVGWSPPQEQRTLCRRFPPPFSGFWCVPSSSVVFVRTFRQPLRS